MEVPRILVIGCGENQVKSITNCVAIDISEEYLKKSKKIKPNNFYLLADVNKLPFIKKAFDKVICTEVLEHTQNPKEVLYEIYHVMNNRGILYLSVPLDRVCEDLAEIFPTYKRDFYCRYHKSTFSEDKLVELFRKNKFRSLKIKCFGKETYYFWHIWARIINLLKLDTYIEESGKICLNSSSQIKRGLFRNLSRTIKIFSFLLSKIIPNENYTNIFVEAVK